MSQETKRFTVGMSAREAIKLTKLLTQVQVLQNEVHKAEAEANEYGASLVDLYKPEADAKLVKLDMEEGALIFEISPKVETEEE